MISTILLVCSLETNVCKTLANATVVATVEECLSSLEIGIGLAEEQGWTVVNYTCLDWSKGTKINL